MYLVGYGLDEIGTQIRFLAELNVFFFFLTASRLNLRYSEIPVTNVKRGFDPG